MIRTEVIQKILDKSKGRTYLEIGVDRGVNFFLIKARRKIAVDPRFKFSRKDRLKWTLRNPCNATAKYYELTSDDYFARAANSCRPEVIFVDGLHTHEQSLRDVNNALSHLTEDGVIIMHDCNPPNGAAAYPADSYAHAASLNLSGWTGEWCGDVWKTVCHLRSNRNDLRIFVLDCDYGLGIITRGKAGELLDLSEQDVDEMTYDELSQDREQLLNLKDETFLSEFLETL